MWPLCSGGRIATVPSGQGFDWTYMGRCLFKAIVDVNDLLADALIMALGVTRNVYINDENTMVCTTILVGIGIFTRGFLGTCANVTKLPL